MAPKYEIRNFSDQKLLNKIKKNKTRFYFDKYRRRKTRNFGFIFKKKSQKKKQLFYVLELQFPFLQRIKLQSIA